MSRHLRSPVLLAACVLAACGSVASADIDQDNLDSPTDLGAFLEDVSGVFGANAWQAQTFTAGLTGSLDRVDILVGLIEDVAGTMPLYIYGVSGGEPDFLTGPIASSMGSYDITGPEDYGVLSADFTGQMFSVAAGQQYAIVAETGMLTSTAGVAALNWVGSSADPYAGGQYYNAFFDAPGDLATDPSLDLNFRTYVTVPSPAGAVLLGLGGLVAVRRRR